MPASTPFLGLYKPGGGSTGLITPDEVVDIDRLNTNSDLIDAFAKSYGPATERNHQLYGPAASLGGVSGMKLGDTYQESDGNKVLWKYDGSGWKLAPDLYALLTVSALSIPNATNIVLGTSGYAYAETLDPLDWHNPTTNPERITPTKAGIYRATFAGAWGVGGTGFRYLTVQKNSQAVGGAVYMPAPATVGDGQSQTLIDMNGTTDYLVVSVYQTNGAPLALTGRFGLELVKAT